MQLTMNSYDVTGEVHNAPVLVDFPDNSVIDKFLSIFYRGDIPFKVYHGGALHDRICTKPDSFMEAGTCYADICISNFYFCCYRRRVDCNYAALNS